MTSAPVNLKRLICGLRGHRITVTPKDETLFAFDVRNKKWAIAAEASCRCGRTHYYEGHQV